VPSKQYSIATFAKLFVAKIRNPFVAGKYGPFVIEVFDKNNMLIARNDDTIYYDVVPGNIIDYSMSMKK